MTTKPATTVEQAWRACNPDLPLSPNDDRYVDLSTVRGETQKIITSIKRSINRSENMHGKFLVSGHRGCGKSTELLRLKQNLIKEEYFCVYIDIEKMFDLGDISYIDVFLSIVERVTEELSSVESIHIDDSLINPIKDWLTTSIYTEKTIEKGSSASIEGEVKLGGGLPSLFSLMSKFRAQMKLNSNQRQVVRNEITKRTSEFVSHINNFLIAINNALGSGKLVVIVDGLEKISYRDYKDGNNSHTEMFVSHAEHLKSLHCHIIYTMPITLAYTYNMCNDFDDMHILPMVKLNDEGIKKLNELIKKRIDIYKVFDNVQDVNELIKVSGGVTRDLMRLVRMATDTDDPKITTKQVNIAMSMLSKEYDRLITQDDIAVLKQVKETLSFTPSDKRSNELLTNRAILEYSNGERWADIHPAILRVSRIKRAFETISAE